MTAYYAQLDTVDFGGDVEPSARVSREVSATTTVAFDMIVHSEIPVLSQTQVFDNPHLLDYIHLRPLDNPLLALIAASRVQTRIYPAGLISRATEEETFSVANAFASRLATTFEFTAWPELNGDADLRRAVLETMEDEDLGRLDHALHDRLEALWILDAHFRSSLVSERAMVVSAPDLSTRIARHMARPGVPRATKDAYHELMRWAEDRGRHVGLNSRTAWRSLLHDHFEDPVTPFGQHRRDLIWAVVCQKYNAVVAQSLGQRVALDDTDLSTPSAMTGGSERVTYQPLSTGVGLGPGEGLRPLSWDLVAEFGRALPAGMSPQRRVEELINRQAAEVVGNDVVVHTLSRLPAAYASLIAGTSGGGVGLVLAAPVGQPVIGAIIGLVGGGITQAILGALPEERTPGSRVLTRWAARHVERRTLHVRDSLLARTDGTED